MKRTFQPRLFFIVALVVLMTTVVSTGQAVAKRQMTIVTAGVGGAWYPIGGVLANLITKNIPDTAGTVTGGGGIANVFSVGSGKADIGFAFPSDIANAQKGLDEFAGKPVANIRVITAIYPGTLHIVARADSDIKTIADLKGKILCVPPKGNTAEKMVRKVLAVYNLSYNDLKKVNYLSYSDSADLIRDGHADIFMAMSTVPMPALNDLAKSKPLRLIPIDKEHMAKLEADNPAYFENVIPGGSYEGAAEPVSFPAMTTLIITRSDLPADLIYQITKTMYENKKDFVAVIKLMDEMKIENWKQTGGVPLHPGAEKFYKEATK
ncbi:MAG: TAXI family TRAP transporter solute-binding subunit [Deltaproteobacteria bacterium]|nr:TAXI family TRAP transporter solute-binding subunit [Deltaproteobacteria bacterium]